MTEKLKFRPNDSEEVIKWQNEVAEEFQIEHDDEYFIVPVTLKDGTKQTHFVPKHTKLEIKGLEDVTHKEVIGAIQKVLPRMDKPGLKEAILTLRKEKGKK